MSKSLLGSYLQFLRSPVLMARPDAIEIAQGKVISHSLRLYCVHLLLVLIIGVAITQALGGELDSNNLQQIFADMPVGFLFTMAVIVAPVVEESIFRLPLRPFALNIALPCTLVILFIAAQVLGLSGPLLILWGSLLAGFNLYLWRMRPKERVLQDVYRRYPRIIFYLSALLFGVLHITNYDASVWALLPLLVLPQFVVGLWLGFIRLRYGFRWAVLAHAFHNGCLLLPMALFKLFGSAELQAAGPGTTDIKSLSLPDQLLTAGMGLYTLAGVAVCGIVAWRVIREWKQNR
ncbi:MAG: CPBP family intramembrane glutamic endopeptidase [Cyanobacteria bacterium P01_F01_bin.53]